MRTRTVFNRTQNTEHRTQNTEHRTQNTEHRTQNTEHRTQNTEHRTQNYSRKQNRVKYPQGVVSGFTPYITSIYTIPISKDKRALFKCVVVTQAHGAMRLV